MTFLLTSIHEWFLASAKTFDSVNTPVSIRPVDSVSFSSLPFDSEFLLLRPEGALEPFRLPASDVRNFIRPERMSPATFWSCIHFARSTANSLSFRSLLRSMATGDLQFPLADSSICFINSQLGATGSGLCFLPAGGSASSSASRTARRNSSLENPDSLTALHPCFQCFFCCSGCRPYVTFRTTQINPSGGTNHSVVNHFDISCFLSLVHCQYAV